MTRENDETRAVRSPHGATRLRSLCELRRASVRRSAHAKAEAECGKDMPAEGPPRISLRFIRATKTPCLGVTNCEKDR